MNNQLTKSNPGSIIEQNQTNVHDTPWTWWFFIVVRCRKSPSNKGKQTPLAKSERPMLKNIKTNPNPNPSFGSIRQGSTLKNLVILRSNFCIGLTDSLCFETVSTFVKLSNTWNWGFGATLFKDIELKKCRSSYFEIKSIGSQIS